MNTNTLFATSSAIPAMLRFYKHKHPLLFGLFALGCLLTVSATTRAAVSVPSVFGDNMVLQRDLPVPVWGTARPGETVTVTFAGQTKTATAGADGKWLIRLDPLATGKTPAVLTITGDNTLRFTNVLVGEVWLCSGQSNMAFSLARSLKGADEVAKSNHPLIRLFHVKRNWSDTPNADVELDAAWVASSPATTSGFSAVGYFFGRTLLEAFKDEVPIGLINSSWGGTRIEPWTSPVGFAAISALASIDTRIQSAIAGTTANRSLTAQTLDAHGIWLAAARRAAAAGKLVAPPPDFPGALRPVSADNTASPEQNPTALYNAMIAPLAPFAIRGAIWYQGEANIADGALYYDKLNALAASWRREFENPALPLHVVQLAPFKYNDAISLPEIWAAQERFARDDAFSGMAVINDVGNVNDIHPTDKLTVGQRLACIAIGKTYGVAQVKYASPAPEKIEFKDGAAVITFANTDRLDTRDGKPPGWFELGGDTGGFRAATATIQGNTVTVTAPGVTKAHAVRYAWSGIAGPNLRDAETGLQVGAFKHGDLPAPPGTVELVPEAANFKVVYELHPLTSNGHEVSYILNNTAGLAGKKIKRIAYFLSTATAATAGASGVESWAFVAMDPFTSDLKKIGVPTKNSGARFQQNVANLIVRSNVPGVKTGAFKQGNIEFWDCNYSPANAANIPGASAQTYDIGDSMTTSRSPGIGSMQIHNTAEKQTIIAYNRWSAGKSCELGIGNQPAGQPDWTFSKSGEKLTSARLLVLVETE
jgi:sialate O-acetylesterase